jgi:hypothetical protein
LLVGLPATIAGLTLLSAQDNPFFAILGLVLLGLLSVIIVIGCSGICVFLAGKLAGSEHNPGLPILIGLVITALALIPIVGWYVFTPLLLLASSGSGILAVFGPKRAKEEAKLDEEKAGGWLGLQKPAWVLFFLSPVVGELLSGSAPPIEFFNPFSILVLTALYGGGALIIRELSFRWQKGWRTILLLGAAYGIIEEGLMVKSFFDPNWGDLGILGTYGRWVGVNWIWSLELAVYHMVFSIAIPILLVNLLFPKERERSWLSNRALIGIGSLFTLDVLIGFFLLTAYRPPVLPYLAALGLVVILCILARAQPAGFQRAGSGRQKKAVWAGMLAFWGTFGVLLIIGIPPHLNIPALFTFMLLAAWVGLCLITLGWLLDWNAGSWRHQFALAAGGLAFFILLTPLQELDTTRVDDPSGMMIVGLLFVIFLALIRYRAKWRERDALPV